MNIDKDLKKIKLNSVYHSDCIELMKSMEENSVDLTVTSPPYDELRNYNGYHFAFEDIAKNLFRITKKGGVLVWVVGDKIKNGNRSLTCFKQVIFFQTVGFMGWTPSLGQDRGNIKVGFRYSQGVWC